MTSATTEAANTSFLAPERLYTYPGFITSSGISKSRIREARLMGIPLVTMKVGKRLYVRGSDGIAFIETLAALPRT